MFAIRKITFVVLPKTLYSSTASVHGDICGAKI